MIGYVLFAAALYLCVGEIWLLCFHVKHSFGRRRRSLRFRSLWQVLRYAKGVAFNYVARIVGWPFFLFRYLSRLSGETP